MKKIHVGIFAVCIVFLFCLVVYMYCEMGHDTIFTITTNDSQYYTIKIDTQNNLIEYVRTTKPVSDLMELGGYKNIRNKYKIIAQGSTQFEKEEKKKYISLMKKLVETKEYETKHNPDLRIVELQAQVYGELYISKSDDDYQNRENLPLLELVFEVFEAFPKSKIDTGIEDK